MEAAAKKSWNGRHPKNSRLSAPKVLRATRSVECTYLGPIERRSDDEMIAVENWFSHGRPPCCINPGATAPSNQPNPLIL